MEKLFTLDHVKMTLGVENRKFAAHNIRVQYAMFSDKAKNYVGVIPKLLEVLKNFFCIVIRVKFKF